MPRAAANTARPASDATLRRHGRRVSRSRVERLMRRADLWGLAAVRRARTTNSRHSYPIAPNRLGRNFEPAAPNQVRLADLTSIPTGEGWLYIAASGNPGRTQPFTSP